MSICQIVNLFNSSHQTHNFLAASSTFSREAFSSLHCDFQAGCGEKHNQCKESLKQGDMWPLPCLALWLGTCGTSGNFSNNDLTIPHMNYHCQWSINQINLLDWLLL